MSKRMAIAIIVGLVMSGLANAAPLDPRETTFIVPRNDGEAVTVVELLERVPGLDLRVSGQGWGATLDKEPPAVLQNLRKNVVIMEMPAPALEAKLRESGHSVVVIVDHHDYGELKRAHPLSSIEQIAALLGLKLNRFQMGVAINDRAYIFGLIDAGYSKAEILAFRERDLMAQGFTAEIVELNKSAYASRRTINGVTVVTSKTTRVGLISDLHTLENPGEVRDLIVVSFADDGVAEVNFYGNPETVKKLAAKLGGWSGGNPERSMYWGLSGAIDLDAIGGLLGQTEFANRVVCPTRLGPVK